MLEGQEEKRNETRAALFGDSDADTDEDHENAKIEFEIEEEQEANELNRKRLNQMVITRMLARASQRKACSAAEVFQSVMAASTCVAELS